MKTTDTGSLKGFILLDCCSLAPSSGYMKVNLTFIS